MSESTDSPTEGNDEEQAQKKTILYCFTREALRPEDLKEVKDALEEKGFTLTSSDSEEKIMIQREKEEGSKVSVSEVLD